MDDIPKPGPEAPRLKLVEPDPRTEEGARQLLSPYLAGLRSAMEDAWKAWCELGEKLPNLRIPLRSRTRANFVYDHIAASAVSRFAGNPRVKISEQRGFLQLLIDRKYALRFKKLDKKKRSCNISTKQQRLWFNVQMTLPEMPAEAVRVIAGYQLNPFGTEVEDILVTRPVQNRVEWSFTIPELESGLGVVVTMQGTPPREAEARSKRPAAKRAGADDSKKER